MKTLYKAIIFLVVICLPIVLQGQSVGNFFGELNIDDSGAATYTLDIPCPSGINGMQPKISLNYNSQSGQRNAGWGWNIGGLSMITRSPKNYYYNDDKSGISWLDDSPLSLDGQRLIQYKYISGRKVKPDSTFYYLENDKTTTIILDRHGGRLPVAHCKVRQKNGITMVYGDMRTYDRTEAVNQQDYASYFEVSGYGGKNLGYALTAVYDEYDNYIQYDYGCDIETNGKRKNSRISKITYGHGKPFSDARHIVGQIEFNYKYKNSWLTENIYLDGDLVINWNVLSSIVVKNGTGQVIETYTLTHSAIEQKDFLTSIKKTNAAGESFKPIAFNWSQPQYPVSYSTSLNLPNKPAGYGNFYAEVFGDFDGDGLVDVLYKSNNLINVDEQGLWTLYRNTGNNNFSRVTQQTWYCQMETNIFFMDLDNDGKDELYIGRRKNISAAYYYYLDCYKYQNGSLAENTSGAIKFPITKDVYDRIGNKNNRQKLKVIPADFIGNGKIQFIVFDIDNKIIAQQGLPAFPLSSFGGTRDANIILTDLNGNGKTEIGYTVNSATNFYEFVKQSPTAGSFTSVCSTSQFHRKDKFLTGDFNGDGNTDFLIKRYSDNKWRKYTSNGKTSFVEQVLDSELPSIVEFTKVILLDANRDGRTDIFYSKSNFVGGSAANATYGILLSNGSSFQNAVLSSSGPLLNGFRTTGDFTNQNSTDIYVSSMGTNQIVSVGKNIIYNKLTRVTDGLGNIQSISYQYTKSPLGSGNKSGYAYDGTETIICGFAAKYEVVKSVTAPYINTSYLFEEPYIHKQGRGFLGFRKITKTDNINATKTCSEKKIDNTFCFMYPYKETQSLTSGQLVSEKIYNYTTVNEGNKVYSLRIGSESSKDYLNSTTITTTYSNYDTSNNAGTILVDYGNGLKEQKTYVWTKVNSGFANRVKSSVITKMAPGETNYVRTEEFEYNTKGKLTKAISDKGKPQAVTTSYLEPDVFGNDRLITVTTGNGTRTLLKTYTNDGRFLSSKTDHLNKKISYEYDNTRGLLTKETDELGIASYQYDNWGRLIKTTYPDKSENNTRMIWITEESEPSSGELDSRTENIDIELSEKYTTGNEIWAGNSIKLLPKFSFLATVGNSMKLGIDPEIKIVLYPNNNSKKGSSSYAIVNSSSGKPDVVTYYDAVGKEVRTITYTYNNKLIYQDIEYDAKGQVKSVTEPYFVGDNITYASTYTYDSYGRILTVETPQGTISNKYEPLKVTTTTPDGTSITQSNSMGQTLVKSINGKMVTYNYYASGLVKKAMPEGGQPVSMEYNLLGYRTKVTDPNTGTITSEYDNWGQLIKETQTVHKGSPAIITGYAYNPLGLLSEKSRNGEKTKFTYDIRSRVTNVSLINPSQINVYSQSFEYDTMNRIVKKTEKIGTEKTFVTSTEYDTYGRVKKEIYPSGYYITNIYDSNGLLTTIKDKNNAFIWRAMDSNAKGQLTKVVKGNNQSTNYSFNSKGLLSSISSSGVINMVYTYDAKNNLKDRQDVLTNQKEIFTYDSMNRLTGWNITKAGVSTKNSSMVYSPTTGDITKMSDLQNYEMKYGEDNAPVNALTSILGVPGTLPQIPQRITYTDFKKIKSIIEGTKAMDFYYNSDDQRYKTVLSNYTANTSGGTKVPVSTRYYAGNYEEEIKGGVTKRMHYISGADGLAAIYIENGTANKLYFAFTDNIGSLVALTESNNNITVAQKYMYSPWGIRLNPADWSQSDTRASLLVERGYTMHEHMREFNLINMDGRVYNPHVAMFMSPDPHVQAPDNWLNYNRYSYCLNNPFRYTDPNGEWFGIDDLLITAAGFVFGYVGHGITQGNWGAKALLSGLQSAGGAWLGFNTMGASILTTKFIGSMAINTVSSMVLPSFYIPLSDKFGFSISPGLGLGPKGLGGGFNYGLSYTNGKTTVGLSAGVGPNHVSYGIGFKNGDVGLSYYRTHYGKEIGPDGLPNNQVVGGAVLTVGGFSFRIENDVMGDRGDRWRTNAVEVGIGKYIVVGTTLNTNDPAGEKVEGSKVDNRPSLSGQLNKNKKGSWKNGQVYDSPFYIGIKHGNNVYRMGYSHPKVQDMTQNQVHREGFFHTILPGIGELLPASWDFGFQNYYVDYDNFQKGAYFYYGNQQPHSLWGY